MISRTLSRSLFVAGALLAPFAPYSAAPAQVRQSVDSDALRNEAQQALSRQDYDTAVAIFEKLARGNAKSSSLALMLGVAQYQKGDCPAALITLRRALQLRPKFPVASAFLGLCHAKMGNSEQSIGLLRDALASTGEALDPELKKLAGTSLAQLYVASGASIEAEAVYLTLMRAFPGDQDILYQSFWLHLGRADQIMRALRKNAPDSYRTHEMLGYLLEGKRMYNAAAEHFRLALKENPAARGLHYEVGNMLLASADRSGAAVEYEEELRVDPCHSGSYYQLGELARQDRQDTDRAAELYTKALHCDPNHVNALLSVAGMLLSKNERDAALAYCERAVKADPVNARGHYLLSRAYSALGRTGEANAELTMFKKLESEASNDTAGLLNLPSTNPANR